MEPGLLVQRDGGVAVVRAEDVAAVPAVVAAPEEVEGVPALGRVAVGGLVVGLYWGGGVLLLVWYGLGWDVLV